MKNHKYFLLLITLLFSNIILSQEEIEVEEVEETIIESTETYSSNRGRRNVKNIYKKGEHFLTGNIENEIYIIKNNATNLYGLQDFNGNLLVRPMFKSIDKYNSSKNRIIASLDYSKKGVIDRKGEIIIPFQYSSITSKKGKQLFVIGKSYSNYSLVDYNAKPIIEGVFESIYLYNDVIKVKRNDAYGIFTSEGKELLPIEYDKVEYNSSSKFFSVFKNGKSTILTKDGKELFNNKYSEVKTYGSYRSDQFLVEKNDKKGIISFDERKIVPIKFEDIDLKSNYQLYIVKQNNLWGVYDSYFDKFLINPNYTEIHQLSKNVYLLISDTKKTIKDIKFKNTVDVSKYNFKNYYLSSSTYLKTENNGKQGLLNINSGKLIVPAKYERIRVNSNFISAYNNQERKYTAYNSDGKIIAKDFNNSKSLASKLYKITKKGKAGLIYNGELLADVKYDMITYFRNIKLIILVKNSTYSLLDYSTGEMLIKDSKDRIKINTSSNKITHKNKNYFYSSGQLKE